MAWEITTRQLPDDPSQTYTVFRDPTAESNGPSVLISRTLYDDGSPRPSATGSFLFSGLEKAFKDGALDDDAPQSAAPPLEYIDKGAAKDPRDVYGTYPVMRLAETNRPVSTASFRTLGQVAEILTMAGFNFGHVEQPAKEFIASLVDPGNFPKMTVLGDSVTIALGIPGVQGDATGMTPQQIADASTETFNRITRILQDAGIDMSGLTPQAISQAVNGTMGTTSQELAVGTSLGSPQTYLASAREGISKLLGEVTARLRTQRSR